MDRLEAMAMFLTAIEKGSLSAAAREMRVPVPTLSRKVADLELLLKTKLLTRTTRQLILTDAGVAYAAAARHVLEQVDEAERQAAGEFTDSQGRVGHHGARLLRPAVRCRSRCVASSTLPRHACGKRWLQLVQRLDQDGFDGQSRTFRTSEIKR